MGIATNVILAGFAGWLTYLLFHLEYAVSKCKFDGVKFSIVTYLDSNWLTILLSLWTVLPLLLVFNSEAKIGLAFAFLLGYSNISGMKWFIKRSRFMEDKKDGAN